MGEKISVNITMGRNWMFLDWVDVKWIEEYLSRGNEPELRRARRKNERRRALSCAPYIVFGAEDGT